MLYFGAIVLLPQLLQEVYGYTATWAGLASASTIGLSSVSSQTIRKLIATTATMVRMIISLEENPV
jgi:DHA2 family multidrug resistance protein